MPTAALRSSSIVFSTISRSTLPSPSMASGLAKKSKRMRLRLPPGRPANSRRWLTDLRSPGSSSESSIAGGKSSGSTSGTASARWPSSPSSFGVIAIWCGPRRPSTWTVRIDEASSASSAWPTISDPANSSRVFERMRATSSATLPLPITAADATPSGGSRSANSGWPLYQPTKAAEPITPGRSAPGIPSGRSCGAPVARITAS